MGRADQLYERLPIPGQHAAVTAYGAYWAWARFGRGYRAHLSAVLARDRWTHDEWEQWQHRALVGVLRDAVDRVPYYRATFSAAQRQAAAAGRLEELPLLEKEPLRADPERFVDPARRPRRPRVFHTSGSSGTPIATIWSLDELRLSMALREARSARWAGVSFRLPRATFSGRMVEPRADSLGPYHRFNAVERQIYLSPFHLGPDTAPAYAEAFRRHGIQWGTGYAVSFSLLAGYLLDADGPRPSLRAVITTSEELTDPMRERIGAAFGCTVREEYSSVENVLFASECSHGSLHVSPDAGLVEILRPDGTPTDPGEVGEVVATGLFRRVQPMIRYRIGDLASWAPEPCPCGRAMPVLAGVSGRVEDVLVGPDGRELVRFHGVFVGLPGVIEAQVVQEAIDRFRVVVVPDRAFTSVQERDVIDRMRQRLGDVVVTVERVDQIPRGPSGKFRAVVSELHRPDPADRA